MSLNTSEALNALKIYIDQANMSYKDAVADIGLSWSASTWSTRLNNPNTSKISEDDLYKINRYLEYKNFKSGIGRKINDITVISEEYMYFSLLSFFGYSFETELETKSLASGIYRLYRPSLKIPDMFTVGLFDISESVDGALKVHEVRHFKGLSEDVDGASVIERKVHEEFKGYMIRKRRRYICIERSTNLASPNFLMSIFNDEFVDNEDKNAKILSLGGVAFGTVGSRMYISKVFIERCDIDETKESVLNGLDYVRGSALKPSVKRYLQMGKGDEYYHVF